jgi:hypothetical protein
MARYGAFAICALLVACGSNAVVKPPAAPPPPEPAPPQPAAPSAFEQKWSSACSEHGAVGQCPAPFDRAAVFVDVGEGEHSAPPFCGSLELQNGAAARDALAAKRKALKACFRGAEPGTFVELSAAGEAVGDPVRARERAACVAKIAKRQLAHLPSPQPERIVVLQSSATKPREQVLSKASVDAVVGDHASDVNACYDAALEVWPGLKGRIASSLVIWFDGNVALVRTGESTLDNSMLECCINTAIRRWTFPKPGDASIVLVTLPFTLGSPR